VKHFAVAETYDGVLAVRIDASFYFGNVTFLKETLKRLLTAQPAEVKAIVIEAASINQLDSSADAALHELVVQMREDGVEIYFANVRGPVREVMTRSGFDQLLGAEHFTLSMTRAVTKALAYVQSLGMDPKIRTGSGRWAHDSLRPVGPATAGAAGEIS